jgi:hypothetical protein
MRAGDTHPTEVSLILATWSALLGSQHQEAGMTGTPRKTSDVPGGRSRQDGEEQKRPRPQPEDERKPDGDVKEPPSPATSGTEEKFPRKGELET